MSLDDEDIDFSDIEQKYAVRFDEGLDHVVVIDNVPVVDDAKKGKLFDIIQKRIKSQVGVDVDKELFHMPFGSDGNSKGYMFVELASADDAALAVKTLDGFPLDKRHRFAVNRFSDIEALADIDENFTEPQQEEYVPNEHLRSWLLDPQGRDQVVMCRGNEVAVAWHNRSSPPQVIDSRPGWTESYVQWSPFGTFLATLHGPGVALWGGPSYKKFMRFSHRGARLVDFSPSEKYMITWSHEPIAVPENAPVGPQHFTAEDEGNRVAVWEVRTGHLLRTFPMAQDEKKGFQWPMLKWSGDDQYCAQVIPGKQIRVYEAPSMGLQDKKSINIEGVVDFEWCPLGDKDREAIDAWGDGSNPAKGAKKPRDNMIAFWVPEVANQPARASVMTIPNREIVRSKNLFNVSDCKLHWHPQGNYLCVKVDRHTKTKKSMFCNFEIFRMREKDFPVEVVELKDPVTAFAWEPQGSHFAVISSNDPNLGMTAPGITIKTQLNFFHLDPKKGDFRLLKMLDNKTCNTVFWSPKGRHVVVATLGSSQKFDLEWYDVEFNAEIRQGAAPVDPADEVKLIGSGEHYGITDLEWDPSGRYVATSASAWRHSLENGYAVWDFRGQELQKHVQDRFKQILWRPRPRSLLSKEDQKRVRRNIRELGKQFEEEDLAEESNLALQNKELYLRAIDEWKAWRASTKERLESKRKDMGLPPLPSVSEQLEQEADQTIEEEVEELLEETEEVVVG
ncbi:translation initiation factor eIF-3b [Jaminaea rosea]|uniref:Eukaryotic translation initiation factor 3 subunit B n=1 Tax=Jaminaea rosea TaxID=1569628 RepID=A0A316UT52_9BASI|nr:translation initiation factor eIF-3b [Jaminaea rosea]PWN27073.1 translation initiation factor eIF-3b [Jaminaea rosea]